MLFKKHVLISLLAIAQIQLKSQGAGSDPNIAGKKEKAENFIIYKDTTIDYNGCLLEFKHNYSKKLFFKTTLFISNPTKQYLALVTDCMYVYTPDSEKEDPHTVYPLIVAPLHTMRYKLRFNGFNLNREQIHLVIHKARMSDEKLAVYEPFKISTMPGRPFRTGNLEMEVMKVQHGDNGRHVRLRITNKSKSDLLAINFSKIYVKLLTGEKVYNDIEDYHRMHQVKEADLNLLVFRIAKGVETDRYIYFDEVFSEYSLKDLKDFKLDIVLNADHSASGKAPSEEKEETDKAEN